MESVLIIFCKTVSILLSVVSLSMLARMILSFLPLDDDNPVEPFLCAVTEPFIIPVRALLYTLNIGQDSPIDWAFCLSYFLLSTLQLFLPTV